MHIVQVALMLLACQQFTVSVAPFEPAVPEFTVSVVAPVVKPQPRVAPVVKAQVTTERWLVSESWCPHCPAAKARFLSSGGQADHVITIAEAKRRHNMTVTSVPYEYTAWTDTATGKASTCCPPVRPQSRKRLPVVRTQWGTIDLETYQRNCNCPMCRGIRALQAQYRQTSVEVPEPVKPEQEPTPADMVDRMLDLMRLTSADVLCDLGCGDGRILIRAAQRTGCRGIGVEIDPAMADKARQSIAAAGLADLIEILTADALDFDPAAHGVTAISAYLFPELLAKLAPKFMEPGVRVVASPFHPVEGLPMTEYKVTDGDSVFVYRNGR